MNSPNPTGSMGSAAPGSAAAVATPSLGALLGSIGGLALANRFGLNPGDPYTGAPVVAAVATFATALFHKLGQWLGVPGL